MTIGLPLNQVVWRIMHNGLFKWKPDRCALLLALGLLLAGGLLIGLWSSHHSRLAGDRLELVVNRIPLGSTAEEAERLVGFASDRVEVESGVMVNVAKFYPAINERAKEHGTPQPHTIHTWKRGPVGASVVLNRKGLVVGRFSWRTHVRRTSTLRIFGIPF